MKISKNLLNRSIEDIIITGYTELGKIAEFHPMMWWVYLKMQKNYVLLTSNSGSISIESKEQVECNFEIEKDDIFTISSVTKTESQYGIISKVDLFYDDDSNLISLGISISEKINYLLFDSLNLDGFSVKEGLDRRFVLNKYKNENTCSF